MDNRTTLVRNACIGATVEWVTGYRRILMVDNGFTILRGFEQATAACDG